MESRTGESADRAEDAADRGVQAPADALVPLLYDDLHRIARHARWRMSGGETLRTTALVNEAYLKLRGSPGFNDQQHFLCAAAVAMRHILVNFARDSMAVKRGGGAKAIPLEDAPELCLEDDTALLEVDEALGRLQALSPRLARVVECRFFAGYSESEAATALGTTDRTVRRDWTKARAWLRRELAASLQ